MVDIHQIVIEYLPKTGKYLDVSITYPSSKWVFLERYVLTVEEC